MAGSDRRSRRHVVLTVHGIRDLGRWQDDLAKLAREQNTNVEFVAFRFNYFDVLSFLIPFARWLVVRRFCSWLRSTRLIVGDADRIDILSHSFGTYVAAHALLRLKAEDPLRVSTFILCGSVLRQSFRWEKLLDTGRVGRVVNECGIYDKPLIASQLFVIGTGMAGKVGFPGPTTNWFVNRYHAFGHSGFFHDEFMARRLVPLLLQDPAEAIEPVDERNPAPSLRDGIWYTFLNNSDPLKLVLYATPPLVVTLLIGWYYLEARINEERALSSRLAVQLSQLAESAKFVDREPGLVQEAVLGSIQKLDPDVQYALRLQRTLRRVDPERQNAAQLRDRLGELEQMLDDLQPFLTGSPTFWHVKGLLHKEQFLSAPNDDPSQGSRLDAAFESAISRYKASGGVPLILCHLDYANCLLALERGDDARRQFTIASELAAADLPKWIRAESHFGLANAIRYAQPELAGKELERAIALVADDEAYAADCGRFHLKLGWFHMDRWDWRRALEQFERAAAILGRPAEMDFAARIDWYHARHGLIMAGAYRDVDTQYEADHWHRAAENYRSLIDELLQLTGTSAGDVLTRRQRQLLRVRILNSYERRGDTLLTRPEIDARDAELAARYYREAAEFARSVAQYEPEETWSTSLSRILSKQTAALAIASDLESAEETYHEAAEFNCAAGLCSTRASLQLNLELARAILDLAKSGDSERVGVAESLRQRITEVIQTNQAAGWRPRRDDLEFLIFTKACLDQVAPEPELDRRMPLHRAVASMLERYQLHLAGFTPGVQPRVALRPSSERPAGKPNAMLELPQRFHFKVKGW